MRTGLGNDLDDDLDWGGRESVGNSLSMALRSVSVISSTARVVLLALTRPAVVLKIFGK